MSENALPPIYCPIAPAVHPAAFLNDDLAIEWLRRHGLCPNDEVQATLARFNGADLVARLFPDGSQRALETITKLHYWGFLIAQGPLATVADCHLTLMRILDAPSSTVLAGEPFAEAFREIHAEISKLASPSALQRWVALHRSFVLGVLWASTYRQVGTVPCVDTVTLIRPSHAGAVNHGIGLMEVAGDFEVPAAELARPEVRALADIASVLLAWDNDICSYLGEADSAECAINLVVSVGVYGDLDATAALAEAIRMRNRAMHRYLGYRARFPETSDEPLHRYVRGLDHQIRGNLDWGVRTTRPTLSLWEQATDRLHGHDLTEPLELPSVRWWWDLPT